MRSTGMALGQSQFTEKVLKEPVANGVRVLPRAAWVRNHGDGGQDREEQAGDHHEGEQFVSQWVLLDGFLSIG